jgi:Dolichyl-phosphate-mannose-protein mannosyltransferase
MSATEGAAPTRSRWRRADVAAVGALVLAGLVARVIVLHSGLGVLDSDEAVVGLMAQGVQHGHLRAMYWGQPYGGTIEQALVAVIFSVVGVSTLAVKIVPIALQAVAALLTWRIGLRVTTRRAAAIAGVLVWVWPGVYVWWSTKERGFYEACLCLSVAVVLLALAIGQSPRLGRRSELGRWALLGLCAGLGVWESPQILYVLVPVSVWLVVRHRTRCAGALVAVPAFVVGLLPWLVWNAANGWRGLKSPPSPVPGGYWSHLRTLARAGLPTALGLRTAYSQVWLAPRWHRELYAVALLLVVIGVVRLGRRGAVVLLVLGAFPFLHAAFTSSGYVGEGRYLYFLLPWLALAIASATRRAAATAIVVVLAMAVSFAGLVNMRDVTSPFVAGRPLPGDLAPLEAALRAHGVTRAWANYWIAYRVTFETRGRVIVAPTTDDRYPAYAATVRSAAAPADVFLAGTRTDTAFASGLGARGIAATRFTTGPWVVYVPSHPVPPTEIPGASP